MLIRVSYPELLRDAVLDHDGSIDGNEWSTSKWEPIRYTWARKVQTKYFKLYFNIALRFVPTKDRMVYESIKLRVYYNDFLYKSKWQWGNYADFGTTYGVIGNSM